MLRLIQWIIFGHVHEWETEDTVNLVENRGGIALGRGYYCKCKSCGKPKLFRCR